MADAAGRGDAGAGDADGITAVGIDAQDHRMRTLDAEADGGFEAAGNLGGGLAGAVAEGEHGEEVGLVGADQVAELGRGRSWRESTDPVA